MCSTPAAVSPVSSHLTLQQAPCVPGQVQARGLSDLPGSHHPKWQRKDCSPVPLTVGHHVHTSQPSTTAATLCSIPWPQVWTDRQHQGKFAPALRLTGFQSPHLCEMLTDMGSHQGRPPCRPCAHPQERVSWTPGGHSATELSSPPLVRREAMFGDSDSKASNCQASKLCAELHIDRVQHLEALVLRIFTWMSARSSPAPTPEN